MTRTRARITALFFTIAAALALSAPASAGYGDVSVSASTRATVDANGPGVPSGFRVDWDDWVEETASGTASSSYRWPAPAMEYPHASTGCSNPSGCVSGEAHAFAAVDRRQGRLRAAAHGSIATSGNNAGFSDTAGVARIWDTITLSAPAIVKIQGSLSGTLGFMQSHDGWYPDPQGVIRLLIGFAGHNPADRDRPFPSLGGVNEEYSVEAIYRCWYPATCIFAPDPFPTPRPVSSTFSVAVPLPAGTSFFAASLHAAVDMRVYGTRGDLYRSRHAASAGVDFANSASFRILIPDGIVATSGSGELPLVGGAAGPEDTEAPEISCDAPPTGWQAADVAIACAASDAGSGLADAADASFTLTTSVPAGDETAGAATGSREVCDAAGNCATAGPFAGLKVDRKAPAVAFAGNAGTYAVDQQVEIRCAASDGGSGIASSSCDGAVGPAWTFGRGTHTLQASATDGVGNSGSATTSFTVVVTGDGLIRLVDEFVADAGVANALKAKLRAAEKGANGNARRGQMRAFANQLEALAGKKLSAEHAAILIELGRGNCNPDCY
jgi:hypothetical protein